MVATAAAWDQDGLAPGAAREILGAVDATCLAQMRLVCPALRSGDMVQAEVADHRTCATGHAWVAKRLQALGPQGLSVVRDRAQALRQRAAQGLECCRMPEVCHGGPELVKSSALAVGRRVRQAHKALAHAEAGLERRAGRAPSAATTAEAEARRAEVPRWAEAQRTSRQPLATLARTFHPCARATARPPTAAPVDRRFHTAVDASAAFARHSHGPAPHAARHTVRTPCPALAALVDCWWHGGGQDVAPCVLSPQWRQWGHAGLLPLVSWRRHGARTRGRRRTATRQGAWQEARATFDRHPSPPRLAPAVRAEWPAWATDRGHVLQRASSAVEGRNGSLSPRPHTQRGLPTQRGKGGTGLPNFDWHAADGPTPAARFCRRAFPDLFETVVSNIDAVPRPRKRPQAMALTG
jgi:hypothetical protein